MTCEITCCSGRQGKGKESPWQELCVQLSLYRCPHPMLEAAGPSLHGMHLDYLCSLPLLQAPHSGAGGGAAQCALQQHLAAEGPAAAVVH